METIEKGKSEEERLRKEYETKEKALLDRIFLLEYENRELGYQIAIANEQKRTNNTKQKNENAEMAEWKLKFELLVKSNEVINQQLLDLKKKLDEDNAKHNEELSKKGIEIKTLGEENKKIKKKYSLLMTDKKEFEEVVLQQEQKVCELQEEINQIREDIDERDTKIKESQVTIEKMNNLIENQKKTILLFQKKTKNANIAPIDSINLNLQNQIKALKKENEQKDNKIAILQMNNKILNSKITKSVPFSSVRSNNSNNSNNNNNIQQQNQQQNRFNRQLELDRAISALEKKKKLEKPKQKSKEKIPLTVNQNTNFVNFYESDPVYCEPSIKLDNEIDDFLKKPLNDYKVLQPSKSDPKNSKPSKQNENDKENQDTQVEFPIIESYSILKSQSEIFDKDDSKVEELQVMVKKILDDF